MSLFNIFLMMLRILTGTEPKFETAVELEPNLNR